MLARSGGTTALPWPLRVTALSRPPLTLRAHYGKKGGGGGSGGGAGGVEDLSAVRNVGVFAHVDHGKTTICERMLFYSGLINRIGNIDDGDTVMDFLPEERRRGITIGASTISFPWRSQTFNLIDTPGHVDFTVEVERSIRVLDGAVVAVDGAAGVQAQTSTVWRQIDRYEVPRIVFVNKMDKEGADIARTAKMFADKFKAQPLLASLPVGTGRDFSGTLDVVALQGVAYRGSDGEAVELTPFENLPHESQKRLEAGRAALLEALSNVDDGILERLLNNESSLSFTSAEIKASIRKATLARKSVPFLCGSALKNKGIQSLLDAVVDYLPSPQEIPNLVLVTANGRQVTRRPSSDDPLCALAFKVFDEPRLGPMVLTRVYSGVLTPATAVMNVNKGTKERVAKIYAVAADVLQEVKELKAGHIGALANMKVTSTGDTIVGSLEKEPGRLKGLRLPRPVCFRSVEPESSGEEENLNTALAAIQREDPSLDVRFDKETNQLLLSGMGELHLEIVHNRLREYYKVNAALGPISIAYRAGLVNEAEVTTSYSPFGAAPSTGSASAGGSSANEGEPDLSLITMTVSVAPRTPGSGNEFRIEIVPPSNEGADLEGESRDESGSGGKTSRRAGTRAPKGDVVATVPASKGEALSKEIVAALSEGAEWAFQSSGSTGYPLNDAEVILRRVSPADGGGFPPDAFKMCLVEAAMLAVKTATTAAMEPYMSLEVVVDPNYLQPVMSDITSVRRGLISNVDTSKDGAMTIIQASVPLSKMMGYSTTLRSMTKGSGDFVMEFDKYKWL